MDTPSNNNNNTLDILQSSWDIETNMNVPGFSLCKKSVRLRRFLWTTMRKATASSRRMTTFTESHKEQLMLNIAEVD